jgi:high affinity sulfate transporter 1
VSAKRWVSAADWVPRYQRAWLRPDLLAGLTIWALVVPEAMAYADIAGVPVQYGLYAVPLAVVAYLAFGTSRHLIVGPSSTVAALSASTVAPVLATGGSVADYIALTAALSLLVGVIYLVLGFARMGFVARFFAKPVLDGFIVGLGLYIAVGQVPKLVGVEKYDGNSFQQVGHLISGISDWNGPTLAVGLASLAALAVLVRFFPKLPGALIVVVGSIVAAEVLGLDEQGVAFVGDVPTGFQFASWSGVSLDRVIEMVPGALAIVVVGFAESLAIAKAYAAKHRYSIDPNQEMIAYGAANIGSGVLQGYTVSGSLSKSAAAKAAGARTQMVLGVLAGATLLTIALLAGAFRTLPEATLAAIIIVAVAGMIDLRVLKRLADAKVMDFYLALAAMLGVLLWDILAGVVIGVVLSLMLLIHRLDTPHAAVLGRNADGSVYRDVAAHPGYDQIPGLLIYRFDAPLIFTNCGFLVDDVTARVRAADPPIERVVLDCETIQEVDTTGLDALVRLKEDLDGEGITFDLAHLRAGVLSFFERMGAVDRFGRDHIFLTVRAAAASEPSTEADRS